MTWLAPPEIIELAREVGRAEHDLAIAAEGNVALLTDAGLWIKASGASMAKANAESFCLVNPAPVVASLSGNLDDLEARKVLNASRRVASQAPPSTETFMHAALLRDGFVASVHTHPTVLLGLVCDPRATQWCDHRLFPDEIVLCGRATAFVPYVRPGFPLARACLDSKRHFLERHGELPKTFWFGNHGLLTRGRTIAEALQATLMAAKAARVLATTLSLGGSPNWLTEEQVSAIAGWPDEHARQRALWR